MSHVLELPDDVYERIEAYAASRGQSPAEVVRAWAAANADTGSATGEQRVGNPAFDPWAGFRGITVMADAVGAVYHSADDPLAAYLGRGELTDTDAIRNHDAVFGAEALNPHDK